MGPQGSPCSGQESPVLWERRRLCYCQTWAGGWAGSWPVLAGSQAGGPLPAVGRTRLGGPRRAVGAGVAVHPPSFSLWRQLTPALGVLGGDHRGDVVKKLEVISLRAQACVPDSPQLILHPRLPQGGSRCSCPWSHHCVPAPAPAECGTRVHASRPQGGPWEVRRSALPPMLCALVPLPPRGHAICTPLGGSQSLGPHLGKPAQCPAPRLRP